MSPYFKDMLLSNNSEFMMLTRIDYCNNNGHGWFSVQIMDSYLVCCYSMITVFVYVCRFAADRSISITAKGEGTPDPMFLSEELDFIAEICQIKLFHRINKSVTVVDSESGHQTVIYIRRCLKIFFRISM